MKDWERAEKQYAKHSGERVVPRSGAGPIQKGDTCSPDWVTEIKQSAASHPLHGPYITIQNTWFEKTRKQADAEGKSARVVLTLGPHLEQWAFVHAGPTHQEGSGSTSRIYLTDLRTGTIKSLAIEGELWQLENPIAQI